VRDEKKELLPAIEKALSEEEANVVVMGFEGRKNGVNPDEHDDTSKSAKPSAQATAKLKDEQPSNPSGPPHRSESGQPQDAGAQRRRIEPAKETLDGMTEVAHSAAEVGQRGARVVQDAMRDESVQIVHRLGQGAEATLEGAKDLSGDLQSFAQTSAVLTRGAHAIASEWLNLSRGRMWRHLGDLAELSKVRSVPEFYEVQRTLVRNSFGQMVADSQRITRLAMKVTDEAVRSMGTRSA